MDFSDVLRGLNERIAEIDRSFDLHGSPETSREYVCECADLHCMQRIELTDAEYQAVRAHPLRFVAASGHVDRTGSRVVERAPTHVVVERAGWQSPAVPG